MENDPFEIYENWNLEPPYFLRKVDAKWHWYGKTDDHEERVKTILAKAFAPDENNCISIYQVQTSDELRRVVVGLDANRGEGYAGKEIIFVAIASEELQTFTLRNTLGLTNCRKANTLHRDILVTNSDSLRELIEAMLTADRQTRRFAKKILRPAREQGKQEFCSVFDKSWACACDRGLFRRLVYRINKWRSKA